MSKPTQARRVVPDVRGHFQRALIALDSMVKDGESQGLTELLIKSFQSDPLRTLDTLSKFCPKELLLDVDGDSILSRILNDVSGRETGLPEPIEDEPRTTH